MKKSFYPLCIILFLSACAGSGNFRDVSLQTTRAELIARNGAPVRSWTNADGTETLEYSSQPYGTTAFMVTVGGDGTVRNVDENLSEEGRAKVERGMTREQVSRLLGKERSVQIFPRLDEEVWDWNIDTVYMAMGQRFNVHFKNGVVARTSITNVFPDEHCFGPFCDD